jgi:adenosylhomocysteine nucleosidase
MTRVVMIAAMMREVQPLVRTWRRTSLGDVERRFAAFVNGGSVVVISGIGKRNAELAARAAVAHYQPAKLISVGLAGGLAGNLGTGNVVTPEVVVDASDGTEYRCAADRGTPGGVLVTACEIAGADAKSRLAEQFHARLVDMEAAGVARAARSARCEFRCVKAISDEADFVMPPLARFVDPAGHFHAGRFAVWTAVRPWLWTRVAVLGRNTAYAARALCRQLAQDLGGNDEATEVVTLERPEFPDVVPGRR